MNLTIFLKSFSCVAVSAGSSFEGPSYHIFLSIHVTRVKFLYSSNVSSPLTRSYEFPFSLLIISLGFCRVFHWTMGCYPLRFLSPALFLDIHICVCLSLCFYCFLGLVAAFLLLLLFFRLDFFYSPCIRCCFLFFFCDRRSMTELLFTFVVLNEIYLFIYLLT